MYFTIDPGEMFPNSNEPEQYYEEELWVEITANKWRPRKLRERAVDTKQY